MNSQLTDGVIRIRPFTLDDAPEHLAGEDSEQVKWVSGGKSTLEGVRAWIEKNQKYWESDGPVFAFTVVEKDSNSLVGMIEGNCGYSQFENFQKGDVNISYALYPGARGKGYATRALNLILKFLMGKGFVRGVIRVNPENIASQKVPERCGFTKEKTITNKKGETFIYFIKSFKRESEI